MARYRVKEGRRFGASYEYGPGAIVEIDPIAAQGFADKLEPVDESAPALASGSVNQATILDDLKIQPEGEEVKAPEGEFKINLEEESTAPKPKPRKKKVV